MNPAVKATFRSEAELCSTFISQLPKGWTAYPETAGFDIVVVRDADGVQIGVEAKLSLNAKVLLQAVEGFGYWSQGRGPDFRAALVPYGRAGAEMSALARHLQITVIEMKSKEAYQALRNSDWRGFRFVDRHVKKFAPELPGPGQNRWLDLRVVDGKVARGHYVKGRYLMDLRSAHPVNFGQIEADYEKWKPGDPEGVVFMEGA